MGERATFYWKVFVGWFKGEKLWFQRVFSAAVMLPALVLIFPLERLPSPDWDAITKYAGWALALSTAALILSHSAGMVCAAWSSLPLKRKRGRQFARIGLVASPLCITFGLWAASDQQWRPAVSAAILAFVWLLIWLFPYGMPAEPDAAIEIRATGVRR